MKKLAILAILSLLTFTPEFSQASDYKANNKTEVNGGGRRKRNGSYRKKKGFMWGIFKGKSQCDCPKH